MSSDFYNTSILPYAAIIIKICRAYTNSQEDYEDYYQEVCLQIWKSRAAFREQSEWSTWIYRISLNVCMTLVKQNKRRQSKIDATLTKDQLVVNPTPFADESLNQLYAAIKQLSKVDRAIILLYLEEKSYQEIADIIGTSSNNIGVRISRIKEKLKKLLS